MSLQYSLYENLLTPQPDDYAARAQNVTSHNLASIIQLMLKRGSTITESDILAVLKMLFEVSKEVTERGETLNLPLFKTSFSIIGVFDRASDSFDPSRHEIKVNATAGKVLKDALQSIRVQKVTTPENAPNIIEVEDSISGSVNSELTSGGVLKMTGSLLKIEGDNPNNGVYFVAADGTKNKVATVVDNKPGQLIVVIPTLSPGSYTLEVVTQYNGGGAGLKEPRTGTFGQTLTVT